MTQTPPNTELAAIEKYDRPELIVRELRAKAALIDARNKGGQLQEITDDMRKMAFRLDRYLNTRHLATLREDKGGVDLSDWHDFAGKISDMLWGGELGWTRTGLDGMLCVLKERLALKNPSDAGGEPIGYVHAPFITERREEYELNGTVMYHQPSGTYTMPVYAAPPQADTPIKGAGEKIRCDKADSYCKYGNMDQRKPRLCMDCGHPEGDRMMEELSETLVNAHARLSTPAPIDAEVREAYEEMPDAFGPDDGQTVGEFQRQSLKWLSDHYLTIRAALKKGGYGWK